MPRSHKSLPRLHVEMALAHGVPVTLGKEQSLYLAAVLRKHKGDDAVLFNGLDGAWRCRITADSKKAVTLDPVELIAAQTKRADLWYGFAPLKTGRLDYLVQKATEMGAGTIQPVLTQYTQGKANPDRLLANAIEAAEQCEVLNVPAIAPEIGLERLLATWTADHGDRCLILCDETAPSGSPIDSLAALIGRPVGLLVGPEGGFSEAELALVRAQPFVIPVSLGPRILRADTAAVAALALVQAIIGDWR